MSAASDMLAEGFSALADESLGHGVTLYRDDGGDPIVAVVSPVEPDQFDGRISPSVAAAVIISAGRLEFGGVLPVVGDSLQDQSAGFNYRILAIEDLPARPCLLLTCEASKATR